MPDRHAKPRTVSPKFPQTRIAVSLLFFVNGFIVGSWAPKIPEFAGRLGLSDLHLGLMILAFGIGSLVAMPIVGARTARVGSAYVARASSVLTVPALLLLTLAPNVLSAAVTIVFVGAIVAAMDIAMNANAIVVEKRMRRAIMSSCHGFWSLGGVVGASLGGLLIARFGVLGHVLTVTLINALGVALAWSKIAEDGPHPDEIRPPIRLPGSILPYLIGIMALFSMIPEGSVLDWGAIYMRRELGAGLALSGFGFGAFSAAMAMMRFAGDPIREKLGAHRTLQLCTLTALVGMLGAGVAPNPLVAICGFLLAGVGISNMVPIAFSAAGNLPGIAPGIAISMVTFMGYSGILFAPSLIGLVAQHTSFHVIFSALPALFLVVLVLSPLARHADMVKDD